jgi:tetratricopeptide (TPR) repeat protein
VSVVLGAAAYSFFGWGKWKAGNGDPADLAAQARKALDAVKERDLKTTMRPASYDSILMPLDELLREIRAKIEEPSYDPLTDYEYIRARAEPIPEIADAAHRQALSETTFLKKNYRFMEQKGDACRYLASSLWNYLEAKHAEGRTGTAFVPTVADSDKLLAILKSGIDADPQNKFLWYLQSLVERTGGGFAAAQKSLEKALEFDPRFIAGWNDLGLVFINLKDFDKAEFALVKAKNLAAEAYSKSGTAPDGEYLTALMNLAEFHDALASYYGHETRVHPTEEGERELARHRAAADQYAEEIRRYTPFDFPAERQLKGQ